MARSIRFTILLGFSATILVSAVLAVVRYPDWGYRAYSTSVETSSSLRTGAATSYTVTLIERLRWLPGVNVRSEPVTRGQWEDVVAASSWLGVGREFGGADDLSWYKRVFSRCESTDPGALSPADVFALFRRE